MLPSAHGPTPRAPVHAWSQVRCPLKLRPGIFVSPDSALHVSFTWSLLTSFERDIIWIRKWATTWRGSPLILVLLFACFFSAALTSQRFFYALFFARLQVKGVTLDLLNNVFLLHFALEATQCIFEGLALLKSYFCQLNYTPKPVPFGRG